MESLSSDMEGLLSLYEASHLGMHGESILEEAKDFSIKNLKSLMAKLNSNSAEQVRQSLEIPLYCINMNSRDATQPAMCPAANLAMVNMTSGGATQPAMCPANNAMRPAANRTTKSTPSILGVTLPISATENCVVEYAHNPEDPIRPPLVAVLEYKATKYMHKSPQNMATSLAILNRKKSSGLGKIHAALACYGTQRASQVTYDSLHQDQRAPQDQIQCSKERIRHHMNCPGIKSASEDQSN
jgi:hypothetical protein